MVDTSELDVFRVVVDRELAYGAFADEDLPVVNDDGDAPVVVSLDEERLSVLLRRIENVGGYANVFVRSASRIRRFSVLNVAGALDVRDAEDLTAVTDQPNGNSDVGTFVDYLERRPRGIVLPARLAGVGLDARTLPARQVEVVGL
jgi:hypothetical protein